MRKLNLSLMIISASFMMFMFSCEQKEIIDAPTGVEFTLSPDLVNSDNGRLDQEHPVVGEGMCNLALADYAIVVIDGSSYTVDIKQWGGDYKTNLVELMPGNYTVESFVVYDEDDNALFATPMMGSEFESFVSVPLPVEFTVENYQKLQYEVEVLCVEDFTPPEFGFVFWNIDLISTKNLCVFVNYCDPDYGHKVATLEAWIYPSADETEEEDLIWNATADGDYESETESNELLCLKFPFDPEIAAVEQSFYVVMDINGTIFTGTVDLALVDEYSGSYLHLNENCDGDFGPFETTFNISWEDINDDKGAGIENDLDYNDFLVETTVYTDANGLNFYFDPLARGASYDHAFRMKLPGLPSEYMITESSMGSTSPATLIASPTGGDSTYVVVYPATRDAFTINGGYVNVECGGTTGDGVPKTITIQKAADDFSFYLPNPFTANLNVNGGPDYDLYLGKTQVSEFSKGGMSFRNGLVTPNDWAWPTEGTDIRDIYGDDFETDFTPDSPASSRPGSLLYTECP